MKEAVHEEGDEMRWIFCFVYRRNLSPTLLYLADMFINKSKSKLNGFCTEWFQIQEKFTTSFEEMSPQGLRKMLWKVLFVAKTWRR